MKINFLKFKIFFSSTFLPLSRQPNTSPHCARWPKPKKAPPRTHLKHNHTQIANSSKTKIQIYTSTTKNVNKNPQSCFFFFVFYFLFFPLSLIGVGYFVFFFFIFSVTKHGKLSKKVNENWGNLRWFRGNEWRKWSGVDLGEVAFGVFDGGIEGFFDDFLVELGLLYYVLNP